MQEENVLQISEESVFQLIVESYDNILVNLKKIVDIDDSALSKESILIGEQSPMDSIVFVSFLTEFEQLLNNKFDRQLHMVIGEIQMINDDVDHISVRTLMKYAMKLLET